MKNAEKRKPDADMLDEYDFGKRLRGKYVNRDADDDLERLLLAHSKKLRAILDAAERRIDAGEGIGHEEFWRQVEAASHTSEKNGGAKKPRTRRRP